MKTLTLKALNKEINITVKLDEVVKSSASTQNDANVTVTINNNKPIVGQVQFIPEWGEYSTNYTGNDFYDEIQEALLSEYKSDGLYDEHGLKTDSCLLLKEEVMPKIEEFVCTFTKESAN